MPPPKKAKDIRAMRIWADSFECWGCTVAFARSDVCSPISYLCRSSCRAMSESVADVEKIIKTSLCVNNFWQSSARSGDPFALAATGLIAPGSIWHCIYGSVLPERKRKQEEGQDAAGCESTPPQQLVFTSYEWPPLPQIFQQTEFEVRRSLKALCSHRRKFGDRLISPLLANLSCYAKAMLANVYESMQKLSRRARVSWTGVADMRQAFACVCGITPHIARRILETAPPYVEQGIDADSVLPGELCPETPGGCAG